MVPPFRGAPFSSVGSGEFVSDIFREIEDELRRDNLLQLWSRYSRYIIAGAVLLVLIAAGIFAWRQHLASERLAQANRYSAAVALARQGKEAEAAKLFAEAGEGGRRLRRPGRLPGGRAARQEPATARARSRPMTASRRRLPSLASTATSPFCSRSCTSSRTAIRRPRSSGSRR